MSNYFPCWNPLHRHKTEQAAQRCHAPDSERTFHRLDEQDKQGDQARKPGQEDE